MAQKLSWDEIKNQYPNEWVELVDFDKDENGYLINGVVIYHTSNKKEFTKETLKIHKEKKHEVYAQRYTGEHKPLRYWESV